MRAGGGYSAIETLVVRGEVASAAEAYRERAQRRGGPGGSHRAPRRAARRAAGSAGDRAGRAGGTAALELSGADDLRVGVALVDLYDRRLGDPGRAMAELRRLIDRHPGDRSVRRLRSALAELKAEHLGHAGEGERAV